MDQPTFELPPKQYDLAEAIPQPISLDLSQAEEILNRLGGEFCFQWWPEPKGGSDEPAGFVTGSFEQHKETLVENNKAGCGIGVVVNEGARHAKSICRFRAIVADFDVDGSYEAAGQKGSLIEPDFVVHSSPGKYHCWYIVDGLSVDEGEALNKRLAEVFGSDPAVTGRASVIRLPGFLHQKGEPFLSHISHRRQGERYTAERIRGWVNRITTPTPMPDNQQAAKQHYSPPVAPYSPSPSPTGTEAASFINSALAANGCLPGAPILDDFKKAEIRSAAPFAKLHEYGGFKDLMLGLKHYGEDTYQFFDEVVSVYRNYDERANRRLWEDARPNEGGLKPFFETAHRNGWLGPPKTHQPVNHQQKGSGSFLAQIEGIEGMSVEWDADNLVQKGSIIGIVGKSYVGKSYCAIALSASFATGRHFLGVKINNPGAAIYLAGEGKHGIKRRFHAWAAHNRVEITQNTPIYIADYMPDLVSEQNVDFVISEIGKVIAEQNIVPKLVVIDTLARTLGGEDENSAAVISKLISGVDKIKNSFPGVNIAIVHHSGHENSGRARGSSAFYAALDTEFVLTKDKDGVKFSVTKQKEGEESSIKCNIVTQILNNGEKSAVFAKDNSFTSDAERDAQILNLHEKGYSNRQIEDEMELSGISVGKSTINRVINKAKNEDSENV